MNTDILIIGAGLAGLSLAERLASQSRNVSLVEARDRVGGRVLSEAQGSAGFDLGPAWFWPGQPRMAALTTRFGLRVFEQNAEGDLLFEDEQGQVQRGHGYASMEGSFRIEGGIASLVQALSAQLPEGTLRLSSRVIQLERTPKSVIATLSSGETITASRVVLALPPRLAAQIKFVPALPPDAMGTLSQIPTWMAGQAKLVAIYAHPFWRASGLSGDAMSRYGPMVEIHDASPAQTGPFALFGFVGLPPAARRDETALKTKAIDQLIRLFGPKAADPVAVHLKDWAQDPDTATEADQALLRTHPRYGMPAELDGLWDGALLFGGSECAPQFGGFLEGALEAAEDVATRLARSKTDEAQYAG
ncbi:MAG: NAD(P)/FAD-dependent oxidoreductase [Litoreibacter sp.]|nr:NAD(P)/FAD-dependent oxidoreductase [Litoreibacter sp.]